MAEHQPIAACPFCGASDPWLPSVTRHAVMCHNCQAEGPLAVSKPEAIELWNRRATGGVSCGGDSWCNRADCQKCNPKASPPTNAPRSISEPAAGVAQTEGETK